MNKQTILGALCILVAVGLYCYQSFIAPQPPPPPVKPETTVTVPSGEGQAPATTLSNVPKIEDVQTQALDKKLENTYVLENDYIAVYFTNFGGAIREVSLKKYARAIQYRDDPLNHPYVFNETTSAIPYPPALNIIWEKNNINAEDATVSYVTEEANENVVRFSANIGGIRVIREYTINKTGSDKDPYVISHKSYFENSSDEARNIGEIYFNIGTVSPSLADIGGYSLTFVFNDGNKTRYEHANSLSPSTGFLGFGKREKFKPYDSQQNTDIAKIHWAAVKNQFFTAILIPKTEADKEIYGDSVFAKGVDFSSIAETQDAKYGLNGSIAFNLGVVQPNTSKELSLDYYVGPKEFSRLQVLGKSLDDIMDFGMFGFFSKILLTMMKWINQAVPNWGLTIICLTIIIKLLLWPLSAKAARSSKRMQKLQKPLAEIREKYKDNPQRQQKETMLLFKEHKVNPAAGCWPMLIQIPIFIGLYMMLRSASELRFAEFLWIHDLSKPDTVAQLWNVPLNILPFFMMTSSFIQMRLMPTPSTDNAQMKMMKWMPVMFFFFCYNFSAGLTLYWTVQNLFSIGQQLWTNRMPDPEGDQTFVEHPVKEKTNKWSKPKAKKK